MKAANLLLGAAILGAVGFAVMSEPSLGRQRGHVMEAGRPVEGARVVMVPLDGQNGGRPPRGKTGQDGSFILERAETGRYQLLAQRGGSRATKVVTVREVNTPEVELELLSSPTLGVALPPPAQPPPDPDAVARRAREILRSRFQLTRQLLDTIRENDRSGLPLPVLLAQAGAESSFKPSLLGKLDEIGLYQLRPATARDQELGPFTDATLLNAGTNIRLATRHLGNLKRLFGSTRLALGAYNQGQGRTQREGLYPVAQVYADAILTAAYHDQFKARVTQLDPKLAREWKSK